jgi:phosphoribosylformimino-5-aminoimidazole carboxamide ribotide isomerase
MEDLKRIGVVGQGKIDLTIGSALDIFGGDLSFNEVVEYNTAYSRER